MNDQIHVDINTPLLTDTDKPKQSKFCTCTLLLCTFTILSTIIYVVFSQLHINGTTHSVSPSLSTMSVLASNDDNTYLSLVVPANENEREEEVDEDVSTYACYLESCAVGYSNWGGRPIADYLSCIGLINHVTQTLNNNWSSAIARVKSLYGVSVKNCLRNKLTSSAKTIDCSWNVYDCGQVSSRACYGKCSADKVFISEPNFWNDLPVVTGGTYDGYYAAPCVVAALTNYLSNFYCLRSDATAMDIGQGFAQWWRETYGGTPLDDCPVNCALS